MVLAILQARCSSTRLPRKVLREVVGRPLLALQIERIRRSARIDQLVVATSTAPEDDALEALCEAEKLGCTRGALEDVLDRFYRTAQARGARHVVRLTGDCPITDPQLIDEVIAHYLDGRFDYVSNALCPSYPDGLDVEVLAFSALEAAWNEAQLLSEREHVTLFIHQRPDRFKIGNYARTGDNLAHLRWTVDQPEDLELIRRIYEALYPRNPAFTTADVLELLRTHPELETLNSGRSRNEGLARSLAEDRRLAGRAK